MGGISGYGSSYDAAMRKGQVYQTESGNTYWFKDSNDLEINDFFNLIAAQLSNQDFTNPVDNTQFMAQMAQFTALQMQQKALYATNQSFATSLIGKTVICADLNEKGELVTTEGVVERVQFSGDGYSLVVDGKTFTQENLMEVVTGEKVTPTVNLSEETMDKISGIINSMDFSSLADILDKIQSGDEESGDKEDESEADVGDVPELPVV